LIYYFAITTYNASAIDSAFSNEVSKAVPDVTPPTVSMTAPAAGVTVAGTVTVSASASDNVGVAGVQFKLDGANLGAEVTTAPYTRSWTTTTTSNGAHTLTAVARDAAGNSTTYTYTVAAYDAAGNVSAQSAAASAATLPPPPADISSGLGLYYRFDEGSGSLASDSSGNGNTGSLLGGTTWPAGKLGQAVNFD